MAAALIAFLSVKMKTDAYMECRGVGHITIDTKPVDRASQVGAGKITARSRSLRGH